MAGRDPAEAHRTATPLELLFDLTFVISFGRAADGLAEAAAAGHLGAGLLGFGVAAFAICLAWSNFSWFASAFDTDDWPFRLATLVQMAGVLVLALGLVPMFASIERGERLDLGGMVAGYVVMRLAMVAQWLRAARQDPSHRRTALASAGTIFVAQLGWIALVVAALPLQAGVAAFAVHGFFEVTAPRIIETRFGAIPWHARHIVERYGLFEIIALGEGLVGTVAVMSAAVDAQGWTLDGGLVCAAGVGLTFGLWWVYGVLPSAEALQSRRDRRLAWAAGQVGIVVAMVVVGAGLHVAAYQLEGDVLVGESATVLLIALPVAGVLAVVYGLYAYLVESFDPFHMALLIATAALIALPIGAARSGASLTTCLIVLTLAPIVTVIGYEVRGYRRIRALGQSGWRATSGLVNLQGGVRR